MATSTQTIVATVKAELASHLPALLVAASVPIPLSYKTGEPDLTPTTQAPVIAVDVPRYRQEGFVGSGGKRANEIIVHIIVMASDPETLASYLYAYLDLVTKVLESNVTIGTAGKLAVTDADSSMNLKGGNALYRAAAVTAELRTTRNRGDA